MEDPSSVPLKYHETKSLLEKIYQENCSADKAEFVGSGTDIFVVQKTSKIVTSDKDCTFNVLYTLSEDGKLTNTGTILPVDATTVASRSSPCGKHKAVIKSNGDNNFILEVYTNSFLVFRKEVKDKWKAIAGSGYLVSFPILWSADSGKFLFTVEPYVAPKNATPKDNFDEAFLGNYKYKHNFGEGHFHFYEMETIIFHMQTYTINKLVGLPKKVIPVHVIFAGAAGNTVCFTGLDATNFIPGIAFANNKRSKVFHYPNIKTVEVFGENIPAVEPSPDCVAVSSEFPISLKPVPSPSGDEVLFFFSSKYREHHKFSLGLAKFTVATREVKVLVHSDEESPDQLAYYVDDDMYSGLYWLDENTVAFKGFERACTFIHIVDHKTGTRRKVNLRSDFGWDTVKVLAVSAKSLVFSTSNYYYNGRVGVVRNWASEKPEFVFESNSPFSEVTDVVEVPVVYKDIHGVFWRKAGEAKQRPTVMILHGGPHSYLGAFKRPYLGILMEMGWQVLTIQFSGTWTFGQDFNERIAGKIGELDVEEILAILKQESAQIDPARLYLDGGSYSGYLGFVFLQKHPHLLKGIISRNPVVDLLYALGGTDIPEWNIVEGLGSDHVFDPNQKLADEQILRLRDLSPAALTYDPTSKTKVLLILGDSDKRVPPGAGYALFRKLKALGLDITCFEYKGEGHAISKSKHVLDIALNCLHLTVGLQ